MTVALTPERAKKLKTACTNLAAEASPSVQEVAHVVGLMVAIFPAVKFAPLFYRDLERDKTHALKVHKGKYTASMTLSQDALGDLRWWISNVETSLEPVQVGKPDIVIQSDTSTSGWGIYCDGKRAGGPWGETQVNAHINVLETTAAFLALQSFCSAYDNKNIRLEMDNTTLYLMLIIWVETTLLNVMQQHNRCGFGAFREIFGYLPVTFRGSLMWKQIDCQGRLMTTQSGH